MPDIIIINGMYGTIGQIDLLTNGIGGIVKINFSAYTNCCEKAMNTRTTKMENIMCFLTLKKLEIV